MAAANEFNRIGSKDGGTPERKKTAGSATGTAEKRPHSPTHRLTDSLGAFGAHVEARVDAVEKGISTVHHDVEALSCEVQELKQRLHEIAISKLVCVGTPGINAGDPEASV